MSSSLTLSAAAAILSGCFLIPNAITTSVSAFVAVPNKQFSRSLHHQSSGNSRIHSQSQQLIDVEVEAQTSSTSSTPRKSLDPKQAEKFKIVTCMSTSCAKKRQVLGLDDLHTFTQFYARINDDERNGVSSETAAALKSIQLEEGPCLGACKRSPCVAVEHDDYVGSVSLESGMTQEEFNDRV